MLSTVTWYKTSCPDEIASYSHDWAIESQSVLWSKGKTQNDKLLGSEDQKSSMGARMNSCKGAKSTSSISSPSLPQSLHSSSLPSLSLLPYPLRPFFSAVKRIPLIQLEICHCGNAVSSPQWSPGQSHGRIRNMGIFWAVKRALWQRFWLFSANQNVVIEAIVALYIFHGRV